MRNEKLVISQIKAGFGNQLFQYATGYALAKRICAKYKLDLSHYTNENRLQFKLDFLNIAIEEASAEEISLLKNVEPAPLFYKFLNKLGIYSRYRKESHINEQFGFDGDKRILHTVSSSYLVGWCSAIPYFDSIKPELQRIYTLKDSFSKQANKYLQDITNSESVAVHVRRGDYLGLNHFFNVLDMSYYQKAFKITKEKIKNPRFFIFSNDLEWIKKELMSDDLDKVFVDLNFDGDYNGQSDIEEFFLMKFCKHNIIANSSFSWWAAYLNEKPNKFVISPKIWYNNDRAQILFSESPLVEKSWFQI